MFDKAEALTPGVICENLTGCLTAYLLFLCMPTHYERVRPHHHPIVSRVLYTVIIIEALIRHPSPEVPLSNYPGGLRGR